MTTIAYDYFRRSELSSANSAVSATIRNALADTRVAASPEASSLPARAFADLGRIVRECEDAGWDGYEAKPISQKAGDRARAFLDDLPLWMSAPDIVPEADGQIAIEWYLGPKLTFSVSIGQDGPLHYAGLFGHEDEVHGVKAFDGNTVPEEVLQLICKLLRSPATGRAA